MSDFNFPFATWQCHCWLLDSVQVSVRMLPVRLALCDLEAPGWGAFVSALCLCCFLAHRLTVWHFCGVVCSLLFSFAIPIPEVLQCYHLFYYVSDACELISWSPAGLVFGVFFGCLCVFVLFLVFVVCFFCFARWQLNGLCIDPTQFLFCMHIVVMTDVATALIRWICKMQLSFRLDKRPGESHLALDGKKK